MGNDIATWQAMLVDVRKRRQTFDTSEFLYKTGPVQIEFGKVQSKEFNQEKSLKSRTKFWPYHILKLDYKL